MDLSKVARFVTPFMIMAFMGVIMIGIGIKNWGTENNALQFIFGVPIVLGFAGFHFLTRRLLNGNVLTIWIVEGVIVAILWYQFQYVW